MTHQHRRGTWMMVGGTAVNALSAYVFQVVGGRALGPSEFAPVTMLWTVLFLGYTIVLLPVEQLVTRHLVLAGRLETNTRRVVVAVIATLVAAVTGFAYVTRGRLFAGSEGYAVVAAAVFAGYGLYAVGRGLLAGRSRFFAYGIVVAAEGAVRAGAAVAAVLAFRTPLALGWALAAPPLVVLAVAPWRKTVARTEPAAATGSAVTFVGWYLVAGAASQVLLAVGPLAVGALGATAAAVSVFFVTFTLFRGPVSSSYHLLARMLVPLTERADDIATLHMWSRRIATWGIAAAAVALGVGAWVGPPIIEVLYGSDFRPTPIVAALAVSGSVAALAALAANQFVVARGDTRLLFVAWTIALMVGAVVALLPWAGIPVRVGAGYAVGEVAALLLIATLLGLKLRGLPADG